MTAKVIGLTGQSGSGKTTVCEVFAKSDFGVINADYVARSVIKHGSECLKKTVEVFGKYILSENGELDREKLADIVFTDKNKLKTYEKIIYPYIINRIADDISDFENKGQNLILLDAPTLFESGADKLCDLIVCVIAAKDKRIERIVTRDDISHVQAENRINSQKNDEFYISKADFVIYNNGTPEELAVRTNDVINSVKERLNAKQGEEEK